MTAERNLGSPNSSSNYPAYEAASLSGIARWKIQELLYLRVNPKGGWLEKSCCWCTEPRIVLSQSASRWLSLGWETFWRNPYCWPVDQLIIHIGVEFICKQPTLLRLESQQIEGKIRTLVSQLPDIGKPLNVQNQNLQYQTPLSPEMQMKLLNLDILWILT